MASAPGVGSPMNTPRGGGIAADKRKSSSRVRFRADRIWPTREHPSVLVPDPHVIGADLPAFDLEHPVARGALGLVVEVRPRRDAADRHARAVGSGQRL